MATPAQVLYAKDKRNSYNSLATEQLNQQENIEKRNRRMGLGRLAGSLLGGALALSTGGASLLGSKLLFQAAAVGAGSFLGQRLAGGTTRKLDPLEKGKFFREQTEAASDEYTGAISDLKRYAGQRALSDMASTIFLGGLDKIPGLSEAGQKIRGFATGGAEGGVRSTIRGGVDIAKDIFTPGTGTFVQANRGANPLVQSMNQVPFTGTAEQNRALAQTLGLDPNASIVDQMKAKGLDSSFQSRASLFQQNLGTTGADITSKATVGVNAVTGNPESMQFTPQPEEGDFNVLRDLSPNATLSPFVNPQPQLGDFEYIDPSVKPLPADFVGYGQQNTQDLGNYYPVGLPVEDSDLLNLQSNQREFYRINPSYPGTFNPTVPTTINPTIRTRSDYRGGY